MAEPRVLPRSWQTDRLTLRQFRLGDVDDVLAYARDEAWGRFLPVPRPYLREDAEKFIALQLLADHVDDPRWAIEHEGAVVGAVEIKLEREAGVASLHYALARSLWGQGLMTEVVRSVLHRVFTEIPEIVRVASWADIRNVGSWRVMEKAGLVREGVMRSCRVLHGERVDDVCYAILRGDWSARASTDASS